MNFICTGNKNKKKFYKIFDEIYGKFSADGNDEWVSSFNVTIYHNCGVSDVNADGFLNVLDIVRVVNIIVNSGIPSSDFEDCASDVSGDGNINILDVIGIINIVLDEDRPTYGNVANSSRIIISESSLNIVPDGHISGIQISVVANEIFINPDLVIFLSSYPSA